METVRLTVQIRNQRNSKRLTMHKDITINEAAKVASELATDAAKFFKKKEKTDSEEKD